MKRTFMLLLLLLAASLAVVARPYSNADIEAMKYRYEGRRPVKAQVYSRQLPKQYAEADYLAPVFKSWMLPYQGWEKEYRNYFRRHYGDPALTFKPSMLVMHYTVIPSAAATWESFRRGANMSAGDYGTVPGHVSVQLMIDKDGTVYKLMPLDRRCTGAYGVNHVALSVEMVARSEQDLLSRPGQVLSSFRLARYLMARFDIPLAKVVSHAEVGRGEVREYLDLADSKWPDRYPPSSVRTDPGETYMAWLRKWLRTHPPQPTDAGKADPA